MVGEKPKKGGVGDVATIASNVTIGEGVIIPANAMIYEDVFTIEEKEDEEQ